MNKIYKIHTLIIGISLVVLVVILGVLALPVRYTDASFVLPNAGSIIIDYDAMDIPQDSTLTFDTSTIPIIFGIDASDFYPGENVFWSSISTTGSNGTWGTSSPGLPPQFASFASPPGTYFISGSVITQGPGGVKGYNLSGPSVTITSGASSGLPVVTFMVPENHDSFDVPIILEATDDGSIISFQITEDPNPPSSTSWLGCGDWDPAGPVGNITDCSGLGDPSAPFRLEATYTVSGVGTHTLYAWVQDNITLTNQNSDAQGPDTIYYGGADDYLNIGAFVVSYSPPIIGYENYIPGDCDGDGSITEFGDGVEFEIELYGYDINNNGVVDVGEDIVCIGPTFSTPSTGHSVTVTIGADSTLPTVDAFDIPSTYSLTGAPFNVPINTFTSADDIGVIACKITESPSQPDANTQGWTSCPPAFYTFLSVPSAGPHTLYGWAKDAAGNVSLYISGITDDTVDIDISGIIAPTGWQPPAGAISGATDTLPPLSAIIGQSKQGALAIGGAFAPPLSGEMLNVAGVLSTDDLLVAGSLIVGGKLGVGGIVGTAALEVTGTMLATGLSLADNLGETYPAALCTDELGTINLCSILGVASAGKYFAIAPSPSKILGGEWLNGVTRTIASSFKNFFGGFKPDQAFASGHVGVDDFSPAIPTGQDVLPPINTTSSYQWKEGRLRIGASGSPSVNSTLDIIGDMITGNLFTTSDAVIAGRLGIGAVSSIEALEVTGSILSTSLAGSGASALCVDASGNIFVCSAPPAPDAVDPPNILPSGEIFDSPIEVSISHPDSGAEIYYTKNGPTPSDSSISYTATGSFILTGDTTVQAIAIKDGVSSSPVSEWFNHEIILNQLNLPTISPDSGMLTAPFEVIISHAYFEAVMWFDIDTDGYGFRPCNDNTIPVADRCTDTKTHTLTLTEDTILGVLASAPNITNSATIYRFYTVPSTPPPTPAWHDTTGAGNWGESCMDWLTRTGQLTSGDTQDIRVWIDYLQMSNPNAFFVGQCAYEVPDGSHVKYSPDGHIISGQSYVWYYDDVTDTQGWVLAKPVHVGSNLRTQVFRTPIPPSHGGPHNITHASDHGHGIINYYDAHCTSAGHPGLYTAGDNCQKMRGAGCNTNDSDWGTLQEQGGMAKCVGAGASCRIYVRTIKCL